jgi:hypothetical protein
MKNLVPQLSIVIIAIVALTLLMGYSRPSAAQPSQYIVVVGQNGNEVMSLQTEVNQKLSEGWVLQGGVGYGFTQAMVKY